MCITSAESGSGKTAVTVGLGKRLISDGKKVGFLKPYLSFDDTPVPQDFCRDAGFIRKALNLAETVEHLCPLVKRNNLAGLPQSLAQVSSGKDVVLVEGSGISAARSIAEALNCKVMVVEGYPGELSYPELEGRVLGLVRNKVPQRQVSQLAKKDNLLGILPEDRLLFTLTVGDLASCLAGELANADGQAEELIANFMVGAMMVDPGPYYYGRKTGKAVLVRGDRPDMQLAALETQLRCLVLCGGVAPIPVVSLRAQEKKVPLILTRSDIPTAIARIEDALAKTRFHQEKKVPILAELMQQRFNFPAFYGGLGLAG
ncbi:MAG: DRTGG domain-containing protein [Chloroflexota bacterium]